jgi:hypothetical protein
MTGLAGVVTGRKNRRESAGFFFLPEAWKRRQDVNGILWNRLEVCI